MTRHKSDARKALIHERRLAKLIDFDYAVLAAARLGKLEGLPRAFKWGRPIFNWYLVGQKVDASLRRLHKVGWLRLYPDKIVFKD